MAHASRLSRVLIRGALTGCKPGRSDRSPVSETMASTLIHERTDRRELAIVELGCRGTGELPQNRQGLRVGRVLGIRHTHDDARCH